jgi:ATP-dependent NAD(P)H-hydrate dehydratase
LLDLIVHPYLATKEKIGDKSIKEIVDKVSSVFSRLHVLVVGPGLSRDECMINTAKELILKAREQDMAIVVDADGLYLVQHYPETIQDYKKAVLTPNLVEFQRLCERMVIKVIFYLLTILINIDSF